jgi:hypothetical protein
MISEVLFYFIRKEGLNKIEENHHIPCCRSSNVFYFTRY